jgi:SWI/SNF-related matrix-associated actin-dependent regulator 1 of chromatin subfamily A
MPQLREFQVQGSDFLQSRTYALLSDDAGLGKSAQVLDAADKLGLRRVLCIGPAVAGVSWPQQIKEWSPARRFTDLDVASNFGFSPPGFYFVSFDTISLTKSVDRYRALRTCTKWDLVIIDEGQYLKTAGSNRTQRTYGENCDLTDAIAGNAERAWVLSGTLTPNHAGEVFTHLRALFPSVLAGLFHGSVPDQQAFEDEFCVVRNTTYGRVIEGSRNQKVLRAAFAPHLLRRLKKDVMPELPALDWLVAPIRADAAVVQAIYDEMLAANDIPPGDFEGLDDATVTSFVAGFTNQATQRRVLGLAKVPGCAQWARERLDAGEPKVIVFAHHTDVLDNLRDALLDRSPVLFDGRTPHAERKRVVEAFQEDPSVEVFLGQLTAAGTAITLTAAKTELFAEYAGTPGVNYQAASRAHRMGQLDGVQAYLATVPGTLDVRIANTAARRAREISELFD